MTRASSSTDSCKPASLALFGRDKTSTVCTSTIYISVHAKGCIVRRVPTLTEMRSWIPHLKLPPNRRRNRGPPGIVFVGRFAVGMAVAVSAVADVSYLAEVAPKGLRGAMVSTNELAISIGMLTAFLTGHLLRNVHGKGFYLAESTSATISSRLMPAHSVNRRTESVYQ